MLEKIEDVLLQLVLRNKRNRFRKGVVQKTIDRAL
jgi:hypothetical protein